jgi:uncharacterized membrane protein YfcA
MQRLGLRIDWQALDKHVNRTGLKVGVLIALCGYSLGPVTRTDLPAKILGVISTISLTILAALYLFSDRRSFKDIEKRRC